jgi:predicted ATP-binding protein involved in virulence
MIFVASEKKISTGKKRDIAPFKVNGQSHIILQQLSCGTRSKVSFVSNTAQMSPDAIKIIFTYFPAKCQSN